MESGFQEKELATLRMDGLGGECPPPGGIPNLETSSFNEFISLENSSDPCFPPMGKLRLSSRGLRHKLRQATVKLLSVRTLAFLVLHIVLKGETRMIHVRRYIICSIASVAVAMPLLYLHFIGRRGSFHSDCGWITSERLYGWPTTYGTRTLTEPWDSGDGGRDVGPLENFNGLT